MKKICFLLIILCLPLLNGCQNSLQNLVKNNMSEITEDYYFFENQDFSLSVSVGERENPYLIDGIHHATVDFSLIILKDKNLSLTSNTLACKVFIDKVESEIILEYNPISNAYMADLGYTINKGEELEFEIKGARFACPLISQDFTISSKEALMVSIDQFKELLERNISNNNLNGECYLKILWLKGEDLFWCFTFVGRDYKSYNLIISIRDGSILASDF